MTNLSNKNARYTHKFKPHKSRKIGDQVSNITQNDVPEPTWRRLGSKVAPVPEIFTQNGQSIDHLGSILGDIFT